MRRSWGPCVTAMALLCAGQAGASSPGIVIDNTTALDGGTTSLSFNHTIGGGSNRYLLVAVGLNKFMSVAISSVKYNNVNMTQIGTETVGNGCGSTLWALGESSLPAAGTYSVAIAAGGAGFNRMYATAISFTGVDQNNLPSSKASNSSTTTNDPTVDITTQRAQFVVDCACLRGSSMSTNSLAVGANQTQRSNASAQTVVVGVSTEPGANVAAPGTGTTTMSWTGTLSGTLNGWATSAIVLKPSNTTAIRLSDLSARPAGQGGAHLTWHTGLELDNLGFHVYRESSAGPVRITTSPIWGSAWLAGPGVAMTGGGSYSFVDPSPPGRTHARYWLEEIELDGRRHRHGPIVVAGVPEPALPDPTPAPLRLAAVDPPAVEGPTPPWGDAPYLAPGEEHALQWSLAAGAAIKLTVDRDGWYELPQPALVAAGLDPGADPRRLALFGAGRELPILVRGEADGVLDPRDAVAFYGRGLNAPATDAGVYWLAVREGAGRRIERISAAPGASGPGWFPFTVERRPRAIYLPSLKNGEASKFFGPMLGATPLEQALPVRDLVPGASDLPVLEVGLQGGSLTAHAITVTLGGRAVATASFDGRDHQTVQVPVRDELPVDGDVRVAVQTTDGDADVALLDFVRLVYPRAYRAQEGLLRASAAGGSTLRLGGFAPDEPVVVLDVTDEERVVELAAGRADQTGTFGVAVPGVGLRQLLARADARPGLLPAISANRPSRWSAGGDRAGADLVVVGPASLLAGATPLLERRRQEGWTVTAVDVEDVYDEFSYGVKQVHALRSFAARARQAWRTPPRAFLLLGDASLDPRNFLGKGAPDLVPTRLVDTAYLETASDDWLTDLDGDGIADVPVGRLPARTPAELEVMIAKLLAAPRYQSPEAAAGAPPLVFASGADDDSASFSEISARLRAAVPAPLRTAAVDSTGGDPAGRLRGLLGQGTPLLTYVGHGSVAQWAGGLLSNESAATLPDQGPGAFVVSLTCLTGYFQDVYQPSLAEVLLARPRGGAFGAWASSGLTDVAGQAELGRAFIDGLMRRGLTVGEAAMRAKAATTDRDVRSTWVLLGDPTWRLMAQAGGADWPDAAMAPDAAAPADAAAAPDAATADAASAPGGPGGCACGLGGARSASLWVVLLLLAWGARSARRRSTSTDERD